MARTKELLSQLEIELSKSNQSCWTIRQIVELVVKESPDIDLQKLLELEKERLMTFIENAIDLYETLTKENFFIHNSIKIK